MSVIASKFTYNNPDRPTYKNTNYSLYRKGKYLMQISYMNNSFQNSAGKSNSTSVCSGMYAMAKSFFFE